MKPEKHRLIRDLLGDPQEVTRREATLLAGGQRLRYRRWKRVASRSLVLAMVAALAALAIHRRTPPSRVVSAPPPARTADFLTDDQLLALFPNTPVGLAKVGDRKVLIFPRSGDKERFVGQF